MNPQGAPLGSWKHSSERFEDVWTLLPDAHPYYVAAPTPSSAHSSGMYIVYLTICLYFEDL